MSLSAPSSEVAICNLALSRLKAKSNVTQIDPASTAVEELCARWYHQVRQSILRAHPWNFAIKRAQLTPDSSATPAFGFTHAYLIPADFIRFIARYDTLGVRVNDDDYELEGRYLLMNGEDNDTINIRYVYDFQNVIKMDPLFREWFVIELAITLAPNFSGSENRVKVLLEERKDIMTRATAIDGQERPPKRKQRSKLIEARRGYNTGIAGPYTIFHG